jgi:ketosteroid isomerase-like protein
MGAGARTPEELETLFEDACVLRDRKALIQLFGDGAVLAAWGPEVRGAEEIARSAAAMWERGYTYLAEPQRVLQARNTALVVAERGINVVRRETDGSWRYAISLLDIGQTSGRQKP